MEESRIFFVDRIHSKPKDEKKESRGKSAKKKASTHEEENNNPNNNSTPNTTNPNETSNARDQQQEGTVETEQLATGVAWNPNDSLSNRSPPERQQQTSNAAPTNES